MAKQYKELSPEIMQFIADQKIFFVGTAMAEGRINISPKGLDTLRVLNPGKIVWMNLAGSGNETAIHLSEKDRLTLMFCSFEEKPQILRVYGNAKIFHKDDQMYLHFVNLFPPHSRARQIVELYVEMVQTSCGYGVPLMKYLSGRSTVHSRG